MNDAMSLQAPTVDTSGDQLSADWWHQRSPDDLRQIMNRGMAMGPLFYAASAEAERRARERMRIEEAAADARATRNKRLRLMILEGLLALSLMILAWELTR